MQYPNNNQPYAYGAPSYAAPPTTSGAPPAAGGGYAAYGSQIPNQDQQQQPGFPSYPSPPSGQQWQQPQPPQPFAHPQHANTQWNTNASQPPQMPQPPPMYAQQQNQYPQSGFNPQTPPQPMMPPNPLPQSQYSAYPEHSPQARIVSGQSFQGVVAGLSGWNDPPKQTNTVNGMDVDQILKSVESPEGTIVSAFTTALDAVKNAFQNQPSQRAKVDDTDRRIESLFDRLANHLIDRIVIAQLIQTSQALDKRDLAQAQSLIIQMMTSNYKDETSWIVGAKRLIEMYRQVCGC